MIIILEEQTKHWFTCTTTSITTNNKTNTSSDADNDNESGIEYGNSSSGNNNE